MIVTSFKDKPSSMEQVWLSSENCDEELRKNSFNFYTFGIGGKVLSNAKLDFEIAWVDKMTNFVWR